MGLGHSPQIVTRNLLLNLDFGNVQKCYNGSENLLTYSEQFDNAAWAYTSYGTLATAQANMATAPDGNTTADLITFAPDGTGQSRRSQLYVGLTAGTYTASVYVKKGTLSSISWLLTTNQVPYPGVTYNFDTDIVSGTGTFTRTIVGNGWVRLTSTYAITTHDAGIGFIGGSNGTVYAWGAQLEKGNSASPYFPTVTTTRTRPTTATSTIANYSHTINQSQYISYDGATNSIRFDRNETFASFTGSITGSVLDVSAMSGINTIRVGASVSFSGRTLGSLYVTSFGTGIGTTGTYNLNVGIATTTSRAMTAAVKEGGSVLVVASGSLASNTYLYNDHTTEVWARINDINPSVYDFTEGESTIVGYSGFHAMFFYGSTYLRYGIWDNVGTTFKQTSLLSVGTSGSDIVQGRWFHIALTKSGSTFKTYLNGILKYTDTITATAYSGTSNDLKLGSGYDSNTFSYNYFSKNNIGCVKMYNTTLTADEISQNFNALRGRFGI